MIDFFETKVKNLVDVGEICDALDAIRFFVDDIITDSRTVARIFSSEELDRLCQYIGKSKSCFQDNKI